MVRVTSGFLSFLTVVNDGFILGIEHIHRTPLLHKEN